MKWPWVVLPSAVIVFITLFTAYSIPAGAQDCRDRQFRWTADRPQVNLRHIFCGGITHGEPKGFHSTALRASAGLVRQIDGRSDEGSGIYSAMVTFMNGRTKFSTFFPDHCSLEAIVRSIRYAAANPEKGRHRPWGAVGPSAPSSEAEGYCRSDDGQAFNIRVGRLDDGRINTAFPD